MVNKTETGEEELRAWMAENMPHYNPEHNLFYFCLEALKTYKANFEYAWTRSHLEVVLKNFKNWGEWFVSKAPEIEKAVEKLQELEKQRG